VDAHWGGYDQQKLDRIAFGKKHGYEIVGGGFTLSGPKYFAEFQATCLNMIHQYGANEFKFDGTGNADRVFLEASLTAIATQIALRPWEVRTLEATPSTTSNAFTGNETGSSWKVR